MSATNHHWWLINIGSGNGLLPLGNQPLPEPVLTQMYVAVWCHSTKIRWIMIKIIPIPWQFQMHCLCFSVDVNVIKPKWILYNNHASVFYWPSIHASVTNSIKQKSSGDNCKYMHLATKSAIWLNTVHPNNYAQCPFYFAVFYCDLFHIVFFPIIIHGYIPTISQLLINYLSIVWLINLYEATVSRMV